MVRFLLRVALPLKVTLLALPNPAVVGKDRKSTRLNSSHLVISYAVFCLKKKNKSHTSGGLYSVNFLSNYNAPGILTKLTYATDATTPTFAFTPLHVRLRSGRLRLAWAAV